MPKTSKTSITETALEKFRQHAPNYHAIDQEIMERLDAAVIDAFVQGSPEAYTTEEGDGAWLVDLEPDLEQPLYGVVKYYRDRGGRIDQGRKALVTIMKKDFVERLKASGQWNQPRAESKGNSPTERAFEEVLRYLDVGRVDLAKDVIKNRKR